MENADMAMVPPNRRMILFTMTGEIKLLNDRKAFSVPRESTLNISVGFVLNFVKISILLLFLK